MLIELGYVKPHKDRWYGQLARFTERHKTRFGRWYRKTFNICQIAGNYDTGDWVCNTHGCDNDDHNPKAVEKEFESMSKYFSKRGR